MHGVLILPNKDTDPKYDLLSFKYHEINENVVNVSLHIIMNSYIRLGKFKLKSSVFISSI